VNEKVAGLILAAGAGRRFGETPKQLAIWNGKPLLTHVVDAATAVLPRVVVVLGANAEQIAARVDLSRVQLVMCDDWQDGQAESLHCGLQAIGDAEKVLVLLGDQPDVTPELIRRFAAEPPLTRAAHEGRPGHPAVLGPDEIATARTISGDEGLRSLDWRLVEAGVPLHDIDTPDDLEALRREARAVV
jgi:CTP:molybdopterin cytidylyltransferase MocA